MFDGVNDSRPAQPRLSIQIEHDGTWTAFRGAILLATGIATVRDAWDVIDRAAAASARPPAAPIGLPAAPERSRRSWRRSA
jgi:hypothetical protein